MPDRRALPASVFVPESTMKNIARKVAKITDEFIGQVDQLGKDKEQELMTV